MHARRPNTFPEVKGFCKVEWGKICKAQIERLLAAYKKCLEVENSTKGRVT
uniref:Uncharacterized protein n=1 Tax=Anguilla anguilla TaxID=7936 RepID=A0A0E9PDE0_ANGAN